MAKQQQRLTGWLGKGRGRRSVEAEGDSVGLKRLADVCIHYLIKAITARYIYIYIRRISHKKIKKGRI